MKVNITTNIQSNMYCKYEIFTEYFLEIYVPYYIYMKNREEIR
jgi:hypothetical protein